MGQPGRVCRLRQQQLYVATGGEDQAAAAGTAAAAAAAAAELCGRVLPRVLQCEKHWEVICHVPWRPGCAVTYSVIAWCWKAAAGCIMKMHRPSDSHQCVGRRMCVSCIRHVPISEVSGLMATFKDPGWVTRAPALNAGNHYADLYVTADHEQQRLQQCRALAKHISL
jgi:hypothetical protein